MEVEICGIKAEIVKKKMKNIRIVVLPPDGKVRVSAPYSVSKKYITQLLNTKIDWIKNQQQYYKKQNPTDALILFGDKYPIKTEIGRNGIKTEYDSVILRLSDPFDNEKKEKLITEWYRKELKAYIEEQLPVWEEKTGLKSSGFQIKNMKTRRGSCNTSTRKLNFNLHLAKKAPECIDYVILHELAHIKIPNHGAEFKAILDKFMPDWRKRKKYLNGQQP